MHQPPHKIPGTPGRNILPHQKPTPGTQNPTHLTQKSRRTGVVEVMDHAAQERRVERPVDESHRPGIHRAERVRRIANTSPSKELRLQIHPQIPLRRKARGQQSRAAPDVQNARTRVREFSYEQLPMPPKPPFAEPPRKVGEPGVAGQLLKEWDEKSHSEGSAGEKV